MFDRPQLAKLPPLSADQADAEAARLAGLLGDIEARERAINALQAEQVLAVAAYAEGRARLDNTRPWAWDEKPRRVCAAELADARGVGAHAAESHLNDALTMLACTPRTFDRLADGAITLAAARAAADEVAKLRPELQPTVDELVAAEIDHVLPSQARAMARARCTEIHPDGDLAAAMENRRLRYVAVQPSTMTGMALLSAPLPIEQAVACWEALDKHARAARADGDVRTVSQIMADTMVERVTGLTRCTDVPVEVSLVMTDRTLLGMDDRPAQIPGHGPLPATLARALTARAATWIRRLLTDPVDDTVTAIETGRRRFDGDVAEFIMRRDQRCRGIGCRGKIRDLEHILDYILGGPTTAANGAGLCQRCHHLEDHEGVSCEAVGCTDPRPPPEDDEGVDVEAAKSREHARPVILRWRTPIPHVFVTQSPPALGPGTSTLDQLHARRAALSMAKRGPADRPRAAAAPTDRLPTVLTIWRIRYQDLPSAV